jgi:hypothetical protein
MQASSLAIFIFNFPELYRNLYAPFEQKCLKKRIKITVKLFNYPFNLLASRTR